MIPSIDNAPKSGSELEENLLALKMEMAFRALNAQEADEIQQALPASAASDPHFARDRVNFLRELDRLIRKARAERLLKAALPRLAKTVAAALVICCVGFTSAFALSDQVRMKVMKAFFIMGRGNMSVSIQENPSESFEIPADWPLKYYPKNLPEGFELEQIFDTGNDTYTAIFRDQDGRDITLMENDKNTKVTVDTLDAEIFELPIRGWNVRCVKQPETTKFIWVEGDRYYILFADLDYSHALTVLNGLYSIN
jgi:hypothetical protein